MSRNGFLRASVVVIILVTLGLVASSSLLRSKIKKKPAAGSAIVARVIRGEFFQKVVESGDLESSSNVEIRCDVKAKGKAGTAIIKIIPEGTVVKKGDFLVQLDDSVLRDELTEQQIIAAKDEAAVIQAENDLFTAEQVLKEYTNGTYEQERATLEAEEALAAETYRRALEYREYSEKLNRKGYITKTQLQADQFAVDKAAKDLLLATRNLKMFEKFTQERVIAEYKAEIKKQKANKKAAKHTLDLSNMRLEDLKSQVANCRITAPADGTVVYANEFDRRGDTSFVIEEGTLIRDGQPVIRLPDTTKMQVLAKISDSKISQVKENQSVVVRLDTDKNVVVRGKVRLVSAFPLPRGWYQAPIEYEVFIDVVDQHVALRPGQRAKVEILVGQIDDAIQAPLSALIRRDDGYFVLIKNGESIEAREIEIGPTNIQYVVVEKGLAENDEVLIDPDRFIDDVFGVDG